MKKILTLTLLSFLLSSCNLFGFLPTKDPTEDITEPSSDPSEIPTEEPSTSGSDNPTEEIKYWTITISCTEGGSVSGADKAYYLDGETVKLTAVPEQNYEFEGYFVENSLVETSLVYEFQILNHVNINAKFKKTGSGPIEEEFTIQRYSHVLMANDIPSTSGGVTTNINGLVWNYTKHTYKQDNPKGVQIGSKNNPQTSYFTLSTTLPEGVTILSSFVEVAVASGGSSSFKITIGDWQEEQTFNNLDTTLYSFTEINVETQNIKFDFIAYSRAFYIYSFGFVAKVNRGVDLDLREDGEIDADPIVPGKNNIPETNYPETTIDEYYKDIDLNSSNTTRLFSELRTLVSEMTSMSYDNAKYTLQYTDENPNKRGYIYGMYDGDDILSTWVSGNTWNREHVWPCAKMALEDEIRPSASTRNHTSDLHNLRAACPTVNGYHQDKYYGETNEANFMYPNVTNEISGKHNFTGDFRGDVARIMFYMYLRYDGLSLSDDLTNADNCTMGKLSLFTEWNELDPVDNFEIQRNNRIYEYQGNRNPFIDYPNLVEIIF